MEMNVNGSVVPSLKSPLAGSVRPHDGILSAISELADHVRASNLKQADDLLTELLVLLHMQKAR